MARALGRVGVAVAELGGPGEVEKVVIEVLAGARRNGNCCCCCGDSARPRRGFGRGLRVRIACCEEEKKEEESGGSVLLHGGSISG